MATYEKTLTLEKRLVSILVAPDGQVWVTGHAVEVTTDKVLAEFEDNITATLSPIQKRAVADLVGTALAYVEAWQHPDFGP